MELTVVLCNDSDRSRPNQTARLSSLVCSQNCAGYFLFDLKWGLVFYEHVSVDSEKIRRHYKAPPFWVSVQYLFSAQLGIVFFVARTDVWGWHSFLDKMYLHSVTHFDFGSNESTYSKHKEKLMEIVSSHHLSDTSALQVVKYGEKCKINCRDRP